MSWKKFQKKPKIFSPKEKKSKKIGKDGNEDITTVYQKIKLIGSARFICR